MRTYSARYVADRSFRGRAKNASAELAEEMADFTNVTFREAKTMIEAQQKSLDPSRPLLMLTIAGGPSLFRGIARELMAAETSTTGGAETVRAG